MTFSSEPQDVSTTLYYFTPPADGSKPFSEINTDPVTGKRNSNWEREEHEKVVTNLRGKEGRMTLDGNGFQYVQHESKFNDFDNDEKIKQEYYAESEKLIKDVTGASKVVFFDHTIRRNNPGQVEDTPDKRQPVPLVHVDQTTTSSTTRVRKHLPAEYADAFLAAGKRFQIINLWRPIAYPAWDYPLALCDFQSINFSADLVPTTLVYPDFHGETNSVKFSEDHRWYYLRGMRTDETVFIKCFDSVQDGSVAILTPHTAFIDSTTPPGSPLRQSIELRALVFYD